MSVERNYTLLKPIKPAVMMSGQIVRCPKCKRPALVKRTENNISYIHVGEVQIIRDYVKPISASDFCRISVWGKPK